MTQTMAPKRLINHQKTMIFLAFTVVFLNGCAAQTGDFPTIAKRPIENLPIDDQPDAERLANRKALQILEMDSQIQSNLANQSTQARQAHNSFTDRLIRTAASAANAGPKGSESWAQAQSALSDLIVLRNRTGAALSAIDAMVINTQQNAAEQGVQFDMSSLLEAQRQAAAMVANEDAELARLRQILRR